MAERAFDSDGETCFIDSDGAWGWVDDDGNWLGFVPEAGDISCIPEGYTVMEIDFIVGTGNRPMKYVAFNA